MFGFGIEHHIDKMQCLFQFVGLVFAFGPFQQVVCAGKGYHIGVHLTGRH